MYTPDSFCSTRFVQLVFIQLVSRFCMEVREETSQSVLLIKMYKTSQTVLTFLDGLPL